MDRHHEAFCLADRLFFDLPAPGGDSFALPDPGPRWTRTDRDGWRVLHPPRTGIPRQGWKIHVSATMGNAARILAEVHGYCVARNLPFKHLRTKSILLARNAKYAPRSASGKLITIYPGDDTEFASILTDLAAALDGEPGPYILSDLRYGNGPLYVRYGGFAEQWMEHGGKRVPAIAKPDGTLVPDQRRPVFEPPDWVAVPACLEPHLAQRKAPDPGSFPFQVKSSLHFSNGGGVYLATADEDGELVVLKEARPFAGLDDDHTDAVTRLDREHRILTRLAGIPGIPAVYRRFSAGEHEFLAMEHLPGRTLGRWMAVNHPLTHVPDDDEVAAYARRVIAILDRVEAVLAAVHERGVVFADLHAGNILVDDHDGVGLVDFELAFPADQPIRPGFRAGCDRHALAALRLWAFLPLTPLLELDPGKVHGYLEFVARRFDLPRAYVEGVARELAPRDIPVTRTELDRPAPDWTAVREAVATAILASATPDREDRLFPGDVEQFASGGASFGHGAAGVLYALEAAGIGRFPEHERWLIEAVHRDPPRQPGFSRGAHGIAYVLDHFGYHDLATDLVTGCAPATGGHDLSGGLAGIGLTLLHLAGSRPDFFAEAVAIGRALAAALPHARPPGATGRAGLLHGWSGPALLFLHLFDRTADRRWLELADRAIARDLLECGATAHGSLQVRDGRRTLPYLGIGSAGIAVVLTELAARDPGAPTTSRLGELLASCLGEFVIQPGLQYGRAGHLVALAHARHLADPRVGPAIERHLARLGWHAIPYRGGLAFPGNRLLRLSMDLDTGSAGVLLALTSALDQRPVLPFLGAGTPTGEREPAARPPTPAEDRPAEHPRRSSHGIHS